MPGDRTAKKEGKIQNFLNTVERSRASDTKRTGRLFFLEASGGRIHSANADGSDRKVIVTGCRIPDGVVVDDEAAQDKRPRKKQIPINNAVSPSDGNREPSMTDKHAIQDVLSDENFLKCRSSKT